MWRANLRRKPRTDVALARAMAVESRRARRVFGASGSGHRKGLVPDPGAVAGSALFLREDATWATPAAGGLSDGDKGDITVSGGGTVWNIDPGVVGPTELASIGTDRLLGRDTPAVGVVESIGVTKGLEFDGSGNLRFRCENLTSDPGSPYEGQMWLRTDL